MHSKNREWWEKPGLGIQYQIEHRPGWRWNRNYDKFNASMRDEKGNFRFNGPFCKIKEWVDFSKNKVCVDYHLMEIKWHDGICYYNTKLTDWKTPIDYGKQFSEESKKAGIPFMYYYSSIFDHNPMFDDIQPLREATTSHIDTDRWGKPFIALADGVMTYGAWILYRYYTFKTRVKKMGEKTKFLSFIKFNKYKLDPKRYEKYMLKQLVELIRNYEPDGLWMDWYEMNRDRSGSVVMDFMKEYFPNIILTFNNSSGWDLKWIYYSTTEFHNIRMAWRRANKHRNSKIPWELIGPAALTWDRMEARADPLEITRMAAIIMANGGKVVYGMASQMDGTLYPGPKEQMERLGAWYKKRRNLFLEAIPIKYKGKKVPGVKISEKSIGCIGCIHHDDYLLHLIYLTSMKRKNITLQFSNKKWSNIDKILLEPSKKKLEFSSNENLTTVLLRKEDINLVDTILRISKV